MESSRQGGGPLGIVRDDWVRTTKKKAARSVEAGEADRVVPPLERRRPGHRRRRVVGVQDHVVAVEERGVSELASEREFSFPNRPP